MLRRKAVQFLPLKLGDLLTLCDRFWHFHAVQFRQLRFIIKRVYVRHSAGHVEPNNPLGSRFKMRWTDNTVPMRILRILRRMILFGQQ